MSVLDQKLRVSINPKVIDKYHLYGDKRFLAEGWQDVELTPAELAENIDQGIGYTCQLGGARRNKGNFLACDVLSVDIDDCRPRAELESHEFARRHLTMLYTTSSHTETEPRHRLVFALAKTITSPIDMRAGLRSLALRLGGDRATIDAARIFYGSSGSQPTIWDRSIDRQTLDDLIRQGLDTDHAESPGGKTSPSAVSRLQIEPDQPVTLADGRLLPFEQIEPKTTVFCPFHQDRHASAFVVESRIGVPGLHCSACGQTFWPKREEALSYNFFEFEETIRAAEAFFEEHQEQPLFRYDHEIRGLTKSNIYLSKSQYFKHHGLLKDGLNLIKSHKGSGKTEALIKQFRDKEKILLIGHRRSLISQTCKRLNLSNYLDQEGSLRFPRLAISVDSLERVTAAGASPATKYTTIIIDESEQVLAHFLSDTLANSKIVAPETLFKLFKAILCNAKRIFALDADLGWTTFDTLRKIVQQRDPEYPIRIFLNEYPKPDRIDIYDSDAHLLGDLMETLENGNRIFVASNSRKRVTAISKAIGSRHPHLRRLLITSETTSESEVQSFVLAPGKLAEDYDIILASPTLGTGVDISFEDTAKGIDAVYGFFEPQITSHFEFDQQLARVRAAKIVKVWITPRQFQFDTAIDVVKQDLLKPTIFSNLLLRYDDDLRPVYQSEDDFLDMAALVVSQSRASKNNLKRNFIEHKRRQGNVVVQVETDPRLEPAGKALKLLGRRLTIEHRVERLMSASTIDQETFSEIEQRIADNEEVGVAERWNLERTRIERFYRQEISPELIKADNEGRTRGSVVSFETLVRAIILGPQPISGFRKKVEDNSLYFESRFLKSSSQKDFLLRSLLEAAGIIKEGDFSFERFSRNELTQFSKLAWKQKPTVENLFDVDVRSDIGEKPVLTLTKILRIIGLQTIDDGKAKAGGQTVYFYRLDPARLEVMYDYAARRGMIEGWSWINRRYGWSTPPERFDDTFIGPTLPPSPSTLRAARKAMFPCDDEGAAVQAGGDQTPPSGEETSEQPASDCAPPPVQTE